jgi:hypothetical protein
VPPHTLREATLTYRRIAAMPLQLDRIKGHFANSSIPSPSAAFRMALNTGRSAFFGEKYALRKVRESVTSCAKTLMHVDVGLRGQRDGCKRHHHGRVRHAARPAVPQRCAACRVHLTSHTHRRRSRTLVADDHLRRAAEQGEADGGLV